MTAAPDDLLEHIATWHAQGKRVALATLVRGGSSLRPIGSQLAVADDGTFHGSISGGCIEGAVIAQALASIADGQPRRRDFVIGDPDPAAAGLACGGRVQVCIVRIDPTGAFEHLLAAHRARRPAALVTRLFDSYGVSILGFDVVFAEADSSSGLTSLEAIAENELKGDAAFQSAFRRLRGSLDYDRRFAEALSNRPVVLGYYFTNIDKSHRSGSLPEPVIQSGTFKGKTIAFTTWSGFGGNLPEFQKSAVNAGHFNPMVDFDGVSRRVPMLVEHEGKYYESLSLAMVRSVLGKPPLVPGYAEPSALSSRSYSGLEWLELPTARGTMRIPVDENVASNTYSNRTLDWVLGDIIFVILN